MRIDSDMAGKEKLDLMVQNRYAFSVRSGKIYSLPVNELFLTWKVKDLCTLYQVHLEGIENGDSLSN